MSMIINGISHHSPTVYAEQAMEKEISHKAEKANDVMASDQASEPKDKYFYYEKSDAKPTGLYRMGHDKNGNRKIIFDDPNKADRADAVKTKEPPKADGDAPKKSAEKCTTDTDRVDREIKKLREKKQILTRQLYICRDVQKVQKLKKELAQVESELSQKDNDTYRRQNAAVLK